MVARHTTRDFYLDVARGAEDGVLAVNKFGKNTEIDIATPADVWDGGKVTGGESTIWVAPTEARQHVIASTDAGDTVAGAGARTVRVYGLTSWDLAEVSEDIIMNTAAPPTTVNSYVIIHRMKVLTKGATAANIGVITATAAVDGTVTALIEATRGQTLMAIYGIPSTQIFVMSDFYGSMLKSAPSGAGADVALLYNPEPQTQLTTFLTKHTEGLSLAGVSSRNWPFRPYKKFGGPGILKINIGVSVNDTDMSAGFNGFLVLK